MRWVTLKKWWSTNQTLIDWSINKLGINKTPYHATPRHVTPDHTGIKRPPDEDYSRRKPRQRLPKEKSTRRPGPARLRSTQKTGFLKKDPARSDADLLSTQTSLISSPCHVESAGDKKKSKVSPSSTRRNALGYQKIKTGRKHYKKIQFT